MRSKWSVTPSDQWVFHGWPSHLQDLPFGAGNGNRYIYVLTRTAILPFNGRSMALRTVAPTSGNQWEGFNLANVIWSGGSTRGPSSCEFLLFLPFSLSISSLSVHIPIPLSPIFYIYPSFAPPILSHFPSECGLHRISAFLFYIDLSVNTYLLYLR